MKRISLTLLMFVIACLSMAMITDYYSPPVASAGTYSAISGTTPGFEGGYPTDEGLTVLISIGFTFNYCGTAYTEVKMSTNGYLDVGGNHAWEYTYENMLSSTNSSYFPFLAPLWDDLDCAGMSYTTTGAAPNRVFTAQWADAMWDYSGTPAQNFQVKLYETSDKIEFIYGSLVTPSGYPGATIGINMAPGGSGNFYSITPGTSITYSTTVENSSISSPAYLTLGTTYTFNRAGASVPNPAVAVFPLDDASSIPIASYLNWASGGGLPTGYRVFLGTNGAGVTPPTSLANNLEMGPNTTYYPPVNLAINTTYYWQVIPYNPSGPATGCPIWSFTTSGLPLRGEKTIDPAGSGPDNFTSFTAAITALNSAGVGQDGVNFNVPAGLTFNEPAMLPEIGITGTLANPISFTKSGTGSNPLVTVPGTAGTSDYVFKLAGVNYITFDGIDVSNATGANDIEYGYWITDTTMNGGSSNNVIKNLTITLAQSNNISAGVYGIANVSANNSNLFQNINVNSAQSGVFLTGSTSSPDQNNIVQGCTFNNINEYNMKFDYQLGMAVFDNLVNFPMSSDYLANTIYGLNSYELNDSSVYFNTFSGGNVTKAITGMQIIWSVNIDVHHNTISGIVSSATWFEGIGVSSSQMGTINIYNNDIFDIQAGLIAFMISSMRGYNININDNNIYNIRVGMAFWGIHAIENLSLDYPTNIFNNKVYGIELTGDTIQLVSGINAQDKFTNIYNNMVYDITAPNTTYDNGGPQVAGISMLDMQPAQGERGYVYNNTVLLDATGTNNSSTACFYTNFPGPVDLKNNVFVNNSTPGATGKAVAFWKASATFDNYLATMDKNIYYAGTPNASHLIYSDGTNNCQTLADYKALNVGKDQNSYTENAPFVSAVAPYDLHIDPTVPTNVESNGIYLPTVVLDDFDGDFRSITPDIGADEGDFTTFSFLASPANVTITRSGANVQITWNVVAGATGYRVYGSNDAYAATPWGSPLQTVLAPNNSANVSPATQYKFYYVTAYQ